MERQNLVSYSVKNQAEEQESLLLLCICAHLSRAPFKAGPTRTPCGSPAPYKIWKHTIALTLCGTYFSFGHGVASCLCVRMVWLCYKLPHDKEKDPKLGHEPYET